MIDSLNLIIKNVKYIDFNCLINLNIKIEYCSESLIRFSYKGIEFKYDKSKKYLLLIANTHKVLKKREVLLSDKETYKCRVKEIITDILQMEDFYVEVSRIDYYTDLKVDDDIYVYINLLKKHKKRYHYMKRDTEYITSSYVKNKRGQTRLNFYSRYDKTNNISDLGILRLEVQNRPPKIKKLKKNGVLSEIDNYWNEEAMQKYYFNFLEPYLYTGNYYRRDVAKKIIDNLEIDSKLKKKLNKFLLMEKRYGIDGLVKKKKFCYSTVQKYISLLNQLNINPITIPEEYNYKELDNLLMKSKKKAEEVYLK